MGGFLLSGLLFMKSRALVRRMFFFHIGGDVLFDVEASSTLYINQRKFG